MLVSGDSNVVEQAWAIFFGKCSGWDMGNHQVGHSTETILDSFCWMDVNHFHDRRPYTQTSSSEIENSRISLFSKKLFTIKSRKTQ